MKLKIALIVAAALLVGFVMFRGSGNVSGKDARRLVEGGALLLDVRTPGEFAAGHLPGAVNIPVQELERRLGEVGPKERPIVVYCRSGNRSKTAERLLEDAGHAEVHDLGAMNNW